ncbi:DUF1212-domain-containing protein [Xylariaceae sp. FL1272]|nr:DUF1212-domain-containing protein [Xylariaceae sp. FL1272]
MESHSSEHPREADDKVNTSSTAVNSAAGTAGQERPKVRFNSKENLPVLATKAREEQQQGAGAGARKLRPALSRNPNSFGSASGDGTDENITPKKAASAAAAAERARAVAEDAHSDYESPPSSRRWSIASEALSDRSYSEVPMTGSAPKPETRIDPSPSYQSAMATAQAEELIKAHMQTMPSASRAMSEHIAQRNSSQATLNPDVTEDYHISSGNGKGGVFYQLLQAYRNPIFDSPPNQARKADSTLGSGSSGRTTPNRRKWYEQEKENRSQETLARLIGASAKLANPNDKRSASPEAFELRKRAGHKRSTSGKILSMLTPRDDEVKITIHVADLLKRQNYIIKMCRALMLFGAPTHRLEEYLATTAKVLEIDSQFLYIPGCMVISFDDVLTHTTEVRIVRTAQGVSLGKLKDVHEIYKEVLHDVICLDDALFRLDQVINRKELYPTWLTVAMYGFASAAVSIFFKARLIDMPIVFAMGTLLGFLQLVVAPRSKTYATVFEVSAAILFSFLSRALASIDDGKLFCFSALTQGSIAMILPGFLVLSSALELQSKAIVPGSIRLVYAIIYSAFLAYGITVGTALYGALDANAVRDTTCHNPLNSYYQFLFVPLYLFFVSFTVQAKWTQMPAMIFVALAGYTVNFFTSQKFAADGAIAYTFGAFTVGVLANLYSRIRHGVAAAVLLPAVYVQVPGSLASTGAITSGLKVAAQLTNQNGTSSSSVSLVASIRWSTICALAHDHRIRRIPKAVFYNLVKTQAKFQSCLPAVLFSTAIYLWRISHISESLLT